MDTLPSAAAVRKGKKPKRAIEEGISEKKCSASDTLTLLWWSTLRKTIFLSHLRWMSWLCCNVPDLFRTFAKKVWVNVRFSVLAGSTAEVVWAYQYLCYHVLVKLSQIFHTSVSSTFQFWNVATFSGITFACWVIEKKDYREKFLPELQVEDEWAGMYIYLLSRRYSLRFSAVVPKSFFTAFEIFLTIVFLGLLYKGRRSPRCVIGFGNLILNYIISWRFVVYCK